MTRSLLLGLALIPLALPTLADPMAQTMTYEIFEAAVPHVDLEDCPAAVAGDDRFCRMAMLNEQLHVFAFAESGDQPMVAFRSWDAHVAAASLK